MNAENERQLALDRAHARFRHAIAGLDPALLETASVVGNWSVHDLIAHLVDWGEEILLAAEHVLGGPPVPHHPIHDFEAFNAASVARHRADPWPVLQTRLDDLFTCAGTLAGSLSPEQLALPVAYPWGDTGTFDGLIRGIDEHQEEHNEHLEAWRHRLCPPAGGDPAR